MSKLELKQESETSYKITGLFTREYINNIISSFNDLSNYNKDININLAGVTSCDSSAVALIVLWQTKAQQNNKKINFTNIPEDIKSILKLSDLDILIC